MKKYQRIAIAALATVVGIGGIIGLSLPRKASANSAPAHYFGTTGGGATVTTADCPIVVKHEQLTFDLVPDINLSKLNDSDAGTYENKVTAEYTFHNPEDYDVHATLVFPFGVAPDYVWIGDATEYFPSENIKVNGETVETHMRHTLARRGEFDIDGDLARLHDDYVDCEFVDKTKPVYHYTATVTANDAIAYLDVDGIKAATNIGGWASQGPNGHESIFTHVDTLHMFELYVFGDEIDFEDRISFYTDGSRKRPAEGEVFKVNCEELTFDDFIFGGYIEDNGVSRVDWYNAAIEVVDSGLSHSNTMNLYNLNLYNRLMQWYEYEIDFPAGADVVNSVTAPMFPDINMDYTPSKYTFTYLLSPATKWESFADIDITVNTDAYILSSTIHFEKTDGGYEVHLDSLPNGELEFELCSSQSPELTQNVGWAVIGVVMVSLFTFGGISGIHIFVTIIIFCVLMYKYKTKWKRRS